MIHFILSIFELLENKKAIVRDFSAVLLESEYKLLIFGIETLIMGNQEASFFKIVDLQKGIFKRFCRIAF